MTDDKYITTADAATLLGVKRVTINSWIASGKLVSRRDDLGTRQHMLLCSDVESLLTKTAPLVPNADIILSDPAHLWGLDYANRTLTYNPAPGARLVLGAAIMQNDTLNDFARLP